MKIKSIKVKNFKSLREVEVDAASFNVVVGQNNHGKTNLFQAVEWFYTGKTETDVIRRTNAAATEELESDEFSVGFYAVGGFGWRRRRSVWRSAILTERSTQRSTRERKRLKLTS